MKTVKRVVDTAFWEDEKVVDMFSPEDKYFMLYLMTNPHTSQVGIYKLLTKISSFELGHSSETVSILLDRFETKYKIIKYDKKTHEIAMLNYLKYSVVKGGKPVEDVIKRDLDQIKSTELIESVYKHMQTYWQQSERPFDKNIKSLFEKVISKRKEPKEIINDNDNDNDNEESYPDSCNDSYDDSSKSSSSQSNAFQEYQLTGAVLSSLNMDVLTDYVDRLGDELVCHAIHYMADYATRPNFNYLKTILNSYETNGFKSVEEVEKFEEKRKNSFKKSKTKPKHHSIKATWDKEHERKEKLKKEYLAKYGEVPVNLDTLMDRPNIKPMFKADEEKEMAELGISEDDMPW